MGQFRGREFDIGQGGSIAGEHDSEVIFTPKIDHDPANKVMGWNLRQKIKDQVGVDVHHLRSSAHTIIYSETPLTEQQKDQIKTILNDPLTAFEPESNMIEANNVIIIKDVWSYKEQLEAALGFKFIVRYRQSEAFKDTTEFDEIMLIPCDDNRTGKRTLDSTEKNNLLNQVRNLGRVE
jgi:hypothetical protein